MTENTRTIKEICEAYGITQTELSRKYGIPLRTVQDWHAGRRTPPDYVVNMIERLMAQQIVRCKDCEHYGDTKYTENGHFCAEHSGAYEYVEMEPDDFCSYGRLKENTREE